MSRTVLILGASGSFGRHAALAFGDAGWTVRRYRRGTDMAAAAIGADLIVNALNPPNYHDWATLLPKITAEVIGAARASGATVLFPGNVYVFGTQPGPWGPTTPHRPVARKGVIRAAIEAEYRAATADGLHVIILRAGDFIDLGNPNAPFERLVLGKLARGRVTALGNPDVRRAHAYLPDMARAAVALAERRGELPAFADIPFPGLTFSTRDLARALDRHLKRPIGITLFPWWAMRLAAPFWELAREFLEMRYLYETEHALEEAGFRVWLPDFPLTSLDDVVRARIGQADIHADRPVT